MCDVYSLYVLLCSKELTQGVFFYRDRDGVFVDEVVSPLISCMYVPVHV